MSLKIESRFQFIFIPDEKKYDYKTELTVDSTSGSFNSSTRFKSEIRREENSREPREKNLEAQKKQLYSHMTMSLAGTWTEVSTLTTIPPMLPNIVLNAQLKPL